MVASTTTRGWPRKTLIPNADSISAETVLAKMSWRRIAWQRRTKGALQARFAAVRVRVADGSAVQLRGHVAQHLSGDEVWLVSEHRSSDGRRYYLCSLPPTASLKWLASLIKARCVCDQAHQQLKKELGRDHFEGRSWHGLHRYALMTLIAYQLLQHLRLHAASQKKEKPPDHRRSKHCRRLGICCLII
ncbi:hypothetical protein [Microvirga sp. KLBC 81]|uniref:hypothetical protein n=1 Tax=Microvirga TaxID=186650 RepID=UPI00105829BD